ncbi:hypothetical protein BB560_005492 [Smittium megazygosporum]|uniref:Dolichyl-phosphate-mannose--protein mannosyltransferase n=1 Tax=Smittium megazygosporum TaxID=133381 RepID=A0A2T9Z4M5_9FUNG|nr:hypothetical protein BB560_005492 [Smittium megazygosporum]
MSTSFQARLLGHEFNSQPLFVADNSTGRIRSYSNRAGLLHSHDHIFPNLKDHFQVTSYQVRDPNNFWTLFLDSKSPSNKRDEVGIFENGDIIRFVHQNSSRVMRVADQPSFQNPEDNMVISFNQSLSKDLQNSDKWKLEINKQQKLKDNALHPLVTKFALRNVKHDCLLFTRMKRLPSWGFYQNEVSCTKKFNGKKGKKLPDEVLWYVEEHKNTKLKEVGMRKYMNSQFLFDFAQLNYEMAKSNNALVPDPDKYNAIESSPGSWPFLYRPMRMVGWGDRDIKYYEIGNPILWWASSLLCCLFPVQFLIMSLLNERKKGRNIISFENDSSISPIPTDNLHKNFEAFTKGNARQKIIRFNSNGYWFGAKLLWTGWVFHYFPFFIMGRVTYLHHYLPALYFALLFLAHQINFAIVNFNRRSKTIIFLTLVVITGSVFVFFFPFTAGYDKPAKNLASRNWRASWNVYIDPFELY